MTVSNPGPVALYSVYPTIYYDSSEKTRDVIEVLPPYSNKQIQITLPHSFLGKDMPNVIKVQVNSSQAEIMTNKKQIVVDSLLVVTAFLIFITVFILVKVKKIKIFSIFAKIGASRNKNDAKSIDQTPQNKNNI